VYRDPEGERQGPYAGAVMLEWFSQGFMHDRQLPCAAWREGEEPAFESLADWLRQTGFAEPPRAAAAS